MRNRCSLLDTVAHPPVRPICSSSSTPTVCSHTYIVFGEMQGLTRDVGLFSPDFYCLLPWLVSCSWVNTRFNQVLLPPLSVCWSVLTLWAVCAGVCKVSLIKNLLYILPGVRMTHTKYIWKSVKVSEGVILLINTIQRHSWQLENVKCR